MDNETFWQWIKRWYKQDPSFFWAYFTLSLCFATCVGIFIYCFLRLVQR